MQCIGDEGVNTCIWWVTTEFSEKTNGYCANPHIPIAQKSVCKGKPIKIDGNREEKIINAVSNKDSGNLNQAQKDNKPSPRERIVKGYQ
jgi:hypothetical protein